MNEAKVEQNGTTERKSRVLPTVTSKRNGGVQQFFLDLGPGLITGAADDDPSGISTY